MVNFEKIFNISDAVCDCIPLVSTITNGVQLLYKLAHKVDAVSNPVNSTWKNDVKIHIINKTKFECFIGMIPVIGNLTNLIYFLSKGLNDQFMCSLINNNTEAVKLHLAKHPLNDDKKAQRILGQAAFSSNPAVFELIFKSREWNIDSLIKALGSCWSPNESNEKNANLILDYYDKYLNNADILEDSHLSIITRILKDFVEADRTKTANRILSILPKCNFKQFQKILAVYSYRSYSSFKSKGILTKDQIEGIISRCNPCTLEQLTEYCRKVHNESESLEREIDFHNDYNKQYHLNHENLNKQEIMNGFYEVHNGIIQELLKIVTEVENSSIIIDALSTLSNNGETQFLEMFLIKYGHQLTLEDKLSIIKKTALSLFENKSTLKGLEYFFTKYNQNFTDEQCIELLQWFSQPPFDNTYIIEKMIEIRSNLKINFNRQLEEIKNKGKNNKAKLASYPIIS